MLYLETPFFGTFQGLPIQIRIQQNRFLNRVHHLLYQVTDSSTKGCVKPWNVQKTINLTRGSKEERKIGLYCLGLCNICCVFLTYRCGCDVYWAHWWWIWIKAERYRKRVHNLGKLNLRLDDTGGVMCWVHRRIELRLKDTRPQSISQTY